MKPAITGLIVQSLLLFIFLFDPTELNIGMTFLALPTWALSIATVLGNVTWLWGLLVLFVAIIYGFSTFYEGGRLLNDLIDEAIKKNHKSSKLLSTVLLITSSVISIIGIGSGFWFVGIATLSANWSLAGYRTEYWKRKDSSLFTDMEDTATDDKTGTEFDDLFNDVIEGRFKNVTDDD